MNIKFSPELEWLRPYFNKVKNIVPVQNLEKVIARKPRMNQLQHSHAQLVTYTSNETGKIVRQYISINLYFIKPEKLNPMVRKKNPFSKIDLLEHFAHELAHLEHEPHTPKHKRLENRICNIFMNMLEKSGYISEEYEMIHNKPKF